MVAGDGANKTWSIAPKNAAFLYERYETRGEAVNAGVEMYRCALSGDGNELFSSEAARSAAPSFLVGRVEEWWPVINEDSIIEEMQDQAYDAAGEWADLWLAHQPQAELEQLRSALQRAFDEWIAATGNEPDFYTVDDIDEIDPRTGRPAEAAPAGSRQSM